MNLLTNVKEALLHLAFPHVCEGCGTDVLQHHSFLCLHCFSNLPQTHFQQYKNNAIEKIFWGRVPLQHATAHYYFTKESVLQQVMHSFKYGGNKELGFYLGQQVGHALINSPFAAIEAIVPLPLFPSKEKKRGFNQATVLSNGIASILQKPVLKNVVVRNEATETQTKKNRVERWQNMSGRFSLATPALIEGKHILLVDDVVTTGATLEACATELLKANNVQVSIAALCYAAGN